ncbi:MAG: DsbC family protein [Aquificota bacterium]|nr:DsbC family protein [Aquificota bacterium]
MKPVKLLFVLPLFALPFFYSCKAQAKCPSEQAVKTSLSKLINREFSVESLKPAQGMPEICEVVVKVGLRPIVIYTNSEGKNIIVGNMFNIDTKENLTEKTAKAHMTVSEEILTRLERHVNMTYGDGEKFISYISDPDCPFCRRLSPALKDWAKKNNVKIKVILYPLPIHPEAKNKSIAMVCDKRGYDDMHTYKNTKNLCEEGKKAIESNMKLMEEIGVTGTPTLIGMNGKYIVGLPRSMDDLKTLIQ